MWTQRWIEEQHRSRQPIAYRSVTAAFREQRKIDLYRPPVITAGIFSALLHRLLVRRCNMLQAMETAPQLLSDAGNRNVPRTAQEQVGRSLYRSIAGELTL